MIMFQKVLLVFCAFYAVTFAELLDYTGSKVFRAIPQDEEQLNFLIDVMQTTEMKVDFWKEPTVIGVPCDIRINMDHVTWLEDIMTMSGLEYSVMIDDVQELIDTQRNEVSKSALEYMDLESIYQYVDDMGALCSEDPDNDCYVTSIGQSYEGRDQKLIKIGRPGENRYAIYIDCGIHAREWITPAICQYIMARLIEEEFANITALRDKFDWYLIPSVNPDGYDYTWTTDRMWRKTRKPNNGSACVGTDPNRNFEVGWGGLGSSDLPCSEAYRGTEPFSEIETKNLDDFLVPIGSQFQMAFTIHSYGQFFVYPWGYTLDEDPDNIRVLADVAIVGEAAIEAVHGLDYTGRRSNGDMAGNTIDWAMGKAGIPFAYLFEVRDTGEYGFLLPPEQIEPTCEEIWTGIAAMAERVALSLP